MPMLNRCVILAVVLVGSQGCASMVYRSRGLRETPAQKVWVTSTPEGAAVRLDGEIVGVTPVQIALPRRGPVPALSISKEGYVDAQLTLKRRLSPATYGNLAFAAMALNPLNGPNGLSDNPWSRKEQVAYAFIFPAVGFGVDFLSGAAYGVSSPVHVTLTPQRPH